MKLKESYIVLQDLRFHAYHGVLPQERLTGNDYVVNLRIGYDIGDAMLSDDVNDTLNYAEVYQLVRDGSAQWLDRACGRQNRRPPLQTFPKDREGGAENHQAKPSDGSGWRWSWH